MSARTMAFLRHTAPGTAVLATVGETTVAEPQNNSQLEIRLLGSVQVHHHGRELDLGGVLPKSLLTVLVLSPGQTLPKDTVIEALWGADPPLTADRLIADYLSRLRTALDPVGDTIRLRAMRPGFRAELDPLAVDAHRLRDLIRRAERDRAADDGEHAAALLRQALSLWPTDTPALADLESKWLRSEARRLRGWRLDALEHLARLELDAGHAEQAAALLRDTAPSPGRENLTAVMILALLGTGETTRAANLADTANEYLKTHGRQPGPALRSAFEDADNSRRSTSPRGPQQLPADTAVFTGRDTELEQLLALADRTGAGSTPGRVVLCAIDGMGGVGKTALAIHAGHRVAERFPDGQFFLDLHGHTSGQMPRSPLEALGILLRAAGLASARIPQDLQERAALWRAHVSGHRMLVLLDNAGSEAQVRPLLPGGGECLVLVTSRKKLKALDEAHLLSLGLLPAADASALFRRIGGPGRIPAHDPALEEVVGWCAGLPLAVRIVGALLRHRPAWSTQSLAAALRDRRRRIAAFNDGDRDIAALFDLSYDALPAAHRQLFRLIALAPGVDVEVAAAAALAGLEANTATRLLEDLVDYNLLDQPVPGRYAMHELAALYGRQRSTHEETADQRNDAIDALTDYYLHTAQRADHHLARRTVRYATVVALPPTEPALFTTRTHAAAWMRANLDNIRAVVDVALQRGRHGCVVAFSSCLHGYLYTDGPWDLALTLHAMAVEAARAIEDHLGLATALHALGRVRRHTGDYGGAINAHREALTLYTELGHRLGQAHALDSVGRINYLTGNFPDALTAFNDALTLYREIGDTLGHAGALNGIGRVLQVTGDYRSAARAHEHALRLTSGHGDPISQATALNDLGRAEFRLGNHAGAARAQHEALDFYQVQNHRLGQANALTDLARVQCESGDHVAAARGVTQALDIYRADHHLLGQATALNVLGRALALDSDHGAALDVYEQALDLYRRLDDSLGQTESLNRIGAAHTATGNLAEARTCHDAALRTARSLGYPLGEAEALEGIGAVYVQEHALAQAADVLREAFAIYQRLQTKGVERVADLLGTLAA